MPRKGENIRKRSDGRWEARYIKGYQTDGKAIVLIPIVLHEMPGDGAVELQFQRIILHLCPPGARK